MKKARITVLAIITLLLIIIFSSCSSIDPVTRYAKEHENKSFSFFMNNSESFTINSMKEDKRTLNDKIRGLKKHNGKDSKKESIEETLKKLREKIEELEKL